MLHTGVFCLFVCFLANFNFLLGFPGVSESNESACNAEEPSSIPGSGRSPGEGNGYPLQYSCLENSMDRGAWQVWGRKESDLTKRVPIELMGTI